MQTKFQISLLLISVFLINIGCVNQNIEEMPELKNDNNNVNVKAEDVEVKNRNYSAETKENSDQKNSQNFTNTYDNKDNSHVEQNIKRIRMEEVAKHNKPNDCWTVIHGKVYNFSNLASKHPGGESIYLSCGKDGSELFERKPTNQRPHSERARNMLTNYYIGELE